MKESLNENELNLSLIKCLADFDTYNGEFYDYWFVSTLYTPYFEVLDYKMLGVLIGDLIWKIKDKIEDEIDEGMEKLESCLSKKKSARLVTSFIPAASLPQTTVTFR